MSQTVRQQADIFNDRISGIDGCEKARFHPFRVVHVFQEKDVLQLAEQTGCSARQHQLSAQSARDLMDDVGSSTAAQQVCCLMERSWCSSMSL
ncbi:hypothetical protein [Puniceibacterium sediminis]|uniref:hypothetical protein n=1 Tax=Puniceibacterium sediminis TaxID=1608407 RepID=UPI001131B125|nr:hypothetical protein [Puniceibacterium sediminis]